MAAQIDQQKAAMQAAIAQQGSLGQQRYEAQQKAIQDTQQNAAKLAYGRLAGAPNAPAPPPSMGPALTQQSQLIGDTYAQDSARAAQAYGNEMNRMATANSDYFDQLNAAVPVLQARAQSEANRIQAQLQEQERQRQADAEARQLQLQSQKEAAALQRDKQAFEKEQLDFEREKFQASKDGSRTGAIGNYDDTGKALGYNDDLRNYMKNDKVTLKATNPSTGEETTVTQNPYTYIMEAGQKAMDDPKATWQDVQRAITAAENQLTTGASTPEQQHGWQNERRLVEEQLKPVFGKAAEHPADAQQQIDSYEQNKQQATEQKKAADAQATQHQTVIDQINNASRQGAQNGWHLQNVDSDFDPAVRELLMDTQLVSSLTGNTSTSPKDLYDIGGPAAIQRMLDRLGIKDPTARLNDDQRKALLAAAAAQKGQVAGSVGTASGFDQVR